MRYVSNKALLIAALFAVLGVAVGAAGAWAQNQAAQPARPPIMQLQRQFSGPLQDTLIQRWRDPADGTICYIYLPIVAPNAPSGRGKLVQYGANGIGTISCFPERR